MFSKLRFYILNAIKKDGFAIFDEENRLLTCNDTYRELSHSCPDKVIPGMTLPEILADAVAAGHYALNGMSPRDYVDNYNQRVLSHDYRTETQLELSGDRHIISRVNETDFGDKVVTRTCITELVRNEREQRCAAEALQEAKDRLEQQSLSDPLTQLPNRRHLDRGGRGVDPVARARARLRCAPPRLRAHHRPVQLRRPDPLAATRGCVSLAPDLGCAGRAVRRQPSCLLRRRSDQGGAARFG